MSDVILADNIWLDLSDFNLGKARHYDCRGLQLQEAREINVSDRPVQYSKWWNSWRYRYIKYNFD